MTERLSVCVSMPVGETDADSVGETGWRDCGPLAPAMRGALASHGAVIDASETRTVYCLSGVWYRVSVTAK